MITRIIVLAACVVFAALVAAVAVVSVRRKPREAPQAAACKTCGDTGQVWAADYDGTLYDQGCPDCDMPYPLPELPGGDFTALHGEHERVWLPSTPDVPPPVLTASTGAEWEEPVPSGVGGKSWPIPDEDVTFAGQGTDKNGTAQRATGSLSGSESAKAHQPPVASHASPHRPPGPQPFRWAPSRRELGLPGPCEKDRHIMTAFPAPPVLPAPEPVPDSPWWLDACAKIREFESWAVLHGIVLAGDRRAA